MGATAVVIPGPVVAETVVSIGVASTAAIGASSFCVVVWVSDRNASPTSVGLAGSGVTAAESGTVDKTLDVTIVTLVGSSTVAATMSVALIVSSMNTIINVVVVLTSIFAGSISVSDSGVNLATTSVSTGIRTLPMPTNFPSY